jgi:hypothetical protein
MIFDFGGTIYEPDCPASYPGNGGTELIQAKEKSSSGIVHVESFNVKSKIQEYTLEELTLTDYLDFMDFFVNVVGGQMEEFEFTNDYGETETVRFTSSELSHQNTEYNMYSVGFSVEAVS